MRRNQAWTLDRACQESSWLILQYGLVYEAALWLASKSYNPLGVTVLREHPYDENACARLMAAIFGVEPEEVRMVRKHETGHGVVK